MIVVLTGLENCHQLSCLEASSGCTVSSRFLETASRYSHHPAVVTPSRTYSYGVIAAGALKVSTYLKRHTEFSAGRSVALLAGNSPEYLVAFYGILLARGIAVPLSERMDSHRRGEILADAGACLVLVDPQRAQTLNGAPETQIEYFDLSGKLDTDLERPDEVAENSGSRALILYTSGSTGKPKGVLLSHGNLLSNAESILGYLPIHQSDRALALLPFCHAYGNSVLQTHVLSGATLILAGSTTFPNTIVDALEHFGVSSLAGVPETFLGLITCSDLGARRLSNLKYMTVAGAALAPAATLEIAERISPAQFFVMYGQTEATARLTYLPCDELHRRPTSIGRAIPQVELQIHDANGRPMAIGETGELCARGLNIMLGYWNNVAETKRVLKNGWLHTGDLARVDEEGFVHLAGRCHEQVKIRGLKVVPDDIAAALSGRLPHCQIAVVPFELNETLRLALFVATGHVQPQLRQQIHRICTETLSRHELPSHVELLDELPLTPSLKIDLPALARRAAQCQQRHSVPLAPGQAFVCGAVR